ncbi:MAG: filamentous hemagglutinin N-terminal domain-containing protein [Rhodanobacter sp.]
MKSKVNRGALRISSLAAASALLALSFPAGAVAVGTVAAGSGSISKVGTTTNIDQSTKRLIVNWDDFDIGANEHVQINQPNAKSVILNRVRSGKGTQIDGSLDANGRVFVINPNGISVGKTGTIKADGVVLSTLDVSDADFMATGKAPGDGLVFMGPGPSQVFDALRAAVVNDGSISVGKGGVALLGGQVINAATGSIFSKKGDVALLSGDFVNLFVGSDGAFLPVVNSWRDLDPLSILASNEGSIVAKSGNAVLAAVSTAKSTAYAVWNTGTIKATEGVNGHGGSVRIDSSYGSAWLAGFIDADTFNASVDKSLVIDADIKVSNGIFVSSRGLIQVDADAHFDGGAGGVHLNSPFGVYYYPKAN